VPAVVLVALLTLSEEPPQAINKLAIANSGRAHKQRRAELPQSTPAERCGCSMLCPPFQAVAAYSQHSCHQDLFTPHQAISALVDANVHGEMSPWDDAAMQ